MANRTDPLANTLSGSDPQNLLEYITRQRIYESRFWKEECFGLTVADVLEKATSLQCCGGFPTRYLSLTLKLLQLHPETELVIDAFIEQDEFKYVRALGCLYVRLVARPVDIYETLEPLYTDRRKLRLYQPNQEWVILHMDEFVHQLLSDSSAVGIALPRLPARRTLQEAGYLPEGPRATALADVLLDFNKDPLLYLQHKALVEQCPAAILVWEKRQREQQQINKLDDDDNDKDEHTNKRKVRIQSDGDDDDDEKKKHPEQEQDGDNRPTNKKKRKKKERNYDNLFKSSSTNKKKSGSSRPESKDTSSAGDDAGDTTTAAAATTHGEGSEDFWNEQRAKLGLKPLKQK